MNKFQFKSWRFIICLISISSFSTFSNAKTVHLLIVDSYSKPLIKALIKIDQLKLSKTSDQFGIVKFDLDSGQYLLDIEAGKNEHFHHYIDIDDQSNYPPNSPLVISKIEEPEHKIIIHANPLEHTSLDMATPVAIISGEELVSKRASTLGEILQLEPGLSFSSFGPAVARPVIRGLSAGRVMVTNNQMRVQDASTTSSDHDVGIEPLLLQQIEVVKGPASLLYGSGAIGGVINTVDNKIHTVPIDSLTGGVEFRFGDSATNEKASVFTLNSGYDNWTWHIDGFANETGNIKIPVSAESIAQLNEDGEDTSEFNRESVLSNSYSDTSGGSFGSSYILEDGYAGLSVSFIKKQYGLPGHTEHSEEDELEEIEENVFIDMEQTTIHLQTQFDLSILGLESIFIGVSDTDYHHSEIENGAVGTQFENKANEFKSYIKHEPYLNWNGVAGIQYTSRDFSAIGEEAFIPKSTTNSKALFWLEEKHFDSIKWELGLRFEQQDITLDSGVKRSENGVNYSVGSVYTIKKHNKLALNFSHNVRFPSVEEYFSFGPHLASSTFEIGNPNLTKEYSNNLDFSYRFEEAFGKDKSFSGEINLFYNQFTDYIFAQSVAIDDECVLSIENSNGLEIEQPVEDELNLICYKQKDANYYGAEFKLTSSLAKFNKHQLDLEVFADYLVAKLDSGENLPRIPANKIGFNLIYNYGDFSTDLVWSKNKAQNNVGENELSTPAFDLVNLEFAYRLSNRSSDWYLFLKGKNLLNEEIRDHASFIKDLAPRTKRNWTLGFRYNF
ncbi:MAG: hypothetical protein COA86_03920 [Kangiella sp.]|nr:MAG: hypothetical protein COA86_03920 [Kangiella sp.]